ncbi:MAG: hypothetical protein HC804_05975 [Anaerolineae bacterium]|nr:hypothetical protein [Anaerolineae bacterium]
MIINSSDPAKLTPPRPPTAVYQGCPYFGVADDAGTRLLFPAAGAVCHRAKPESEIDVAYQQTTCLTAEHETCTVFLRQQRGALPPEISGIEGQRTPSHRIFLGVMIILLFAVVGIWVGLWWVNSGGNMAAQKPEATPEATLLQVVAAVSTNPPTTVPATATAVPPTATMPPTATAVPTHTPTPTASLPPTYTPRANTVTPPATAVPLPQAVVNVPRLNVRQGPSTVYDAIALVDEGEQFDVIGRIRDGSWLQVCCIAGVPGWVFTESVSITDSITAVPLITDIPPTPTAAP